MSAQSDYSKLVATIRERGEHVRSNFKIAVTKGIEDITMLEILTSLAENRQDSLRPALTSFSCEAVGGDLKLADTAGLMFMLASTGVAIHDDIIDKSKRKHLKQTFLGKHGTNATLLVGDLLLVKGWANLGVLSGDIADCAKVSLVADIYGRLSTEMCEAEFIENQTRRNLDVKLDYHNLILWKEMAEMEACTRIGTLLGGGTDGEIEALAEYGRRVGYSSRLVDEVKDCLNVDGSLVNRLRFESVPLPMLFAANHSAEMYSKIKSILRNSQYSSDRIEDLVGMCIDSGALSYVRNIGKNNSTKTRRSLRLIKNGFAKSVLLDLDKKILLDLERLCK